MKSLLSPKELARAIGASESSLKRWIDDGVIPAARTAGGHRRIEFADAIRYIREASLPVVDPASLGLPEMQWVKQDAAAQGMQSVLLKALCSGDGPAVHGTLMSMYMSGQSIAQIGDGPLASAMQEIGKLWHNDEHGISIEHHAMDLAIQGISQLRSLLPHPGPKAPLAIGGAVVGDPYVLPSMLVAAVVASEGWRDINLGPDLPLAALMTSMRVHRPRLVWLSCSITQTSEELASSWRKFLKAAEDANTDVVLGGRAADALPRTRSARVHTATHLCDLIPLLHQLMDAYQGVP